MQLMAAFPSVDSGLGRVMAQVSIIEVSHRVMGNWCFLAAGQALMSSCENASSLTASLICTQEFHQHSANNPLPFFSPTVVFECDGPRGSEVHTASTDASKQVCPMMHVWVSVCLQRLGV